MDDRYLPYILAVLVVLSFLPLLGTSVDPAHIEGGVVYLNQDWVVDPGDFLVYNNTTIVLTGNLTVEKDGTLVLRNVTLVMNCTLPHQYTIRCNGTLMVEDWDGEPNTVEDGATITSSSPDAPYDIAAEPGADLTFSRSRIESWNASGVHLFSSDGARFEQMEILSSSPGFLGVGNTSFDACNFVNTTIAMEWANHTFFNGCEMLDSNITLLLCNDTTLLSCYGDGSFLINNATNTSIAGCSAFYGELSGRNCTIQSSDFGSLRLGGEGIKANGVNISSGGLVVEDAGDALLEGCTALNCSTGFRFASASICAGNLRALGCAVGLNLSAGSAGTITDSEFINCSSGITLWDAGMISLSNMTLVNASEGVEIGSVPMGLSLGSCRFRDLTTALIMGSGSAEAINCTFENGTNHVLVNGSGEITLLNSKFNRSRCAVVGSGGLLFVQWFMDVQVIDAQGNGVFMAQVRVQGNDSSDAIYLTNGIGRAEWIKVTEYLETQGGRIPYNPYNISASATGYTSAWSILWVNGSTTAELMISDIEPPRIYPTELEVVQPDDPITLTARIRDNGAVSGAVAHYLPPQGGGWSEVPMRFIEGTSRDGKWLADIPGQSQSGNLTCWIYASDTAGNSNRTANMTIVVLDTLPPVIIHTPITEIEYNESAGIRAQVVDASTVPMVLLNYTDLEGRWHSRTMTSEGDWWSAELPPFNATGSIEYMCWAADVLGNTNHTPVYPVQVDDFTRPRVVDAGPRGVEPPVSTSSIVYVRFSEPMNETSVVEAVHFFGENVSFTPVWSENSTYLVLNITGGLRNDTYYHITIERSARDRNGLSLANDYHWYFYTEGTAPPPKSWLDEYWWALVAVAAAIIVMVPILLHRRGTRGK
ncbi:MAG: Ig-like domain-containing protein [Candidatus Thermoplasmatota archaeon]